MNLQHLRNKSNFIEDEEVLKSKFDEFWKLKTNLENICNTFQGNINIAAQHSKSDLPFFVIKYDNEITHFMNPTMECGIEKQGAIETHFSLIGIHALIQRHTRVNLSYLFFNHENKVKYNEKSYTGVMAVMVQQMMDQLNGIVFLDKAEKDGLIPIVGSVLRLKDSEPAEYVVIGEERLLISGNDFDENILDNGFEIVGYRNHLIKKSNG